MTIQGTVDKTAILLAVTIFAAIWPWRMLFETRDPGTVVPFMILGSFGGFIVAMVTIFKKSWAPVTAPIYAACEGLALGGISAMFEVRYHGIAFQAMALTFGVLAVMLVAYKTRAIRATEGFKLGVIAATGAIALVYLLSMVLGMFGVHMGFMYLVGAARNRHQLGGRGDRRAQPGARLQRRRSRGRGWARRSTWSGTAPSASW